jgi:phage tail-like protein
MKGDEKRFFVINTEELWHEGDEFVNLQVTEQGISLEKSSEYHYYDTLVPGTVEFGSLAMDGCGIMIILDETKKKIVSYDSSDGTIRWRKCLPFENPTSLAVNAANYYVADGETLYVLARVNGQIRRKERIPFNSRVAVGKNNSLFFLDTRDNKVYRVRSNSYFEYEEISLKDKNDNPYILDNPVDIASDMEGDLYFLETEKKMISKFDITGKNLEILQIPFKRDIRFLNLAVESSDNIFLGILQEIVDERLEQQLEQQKSIIQLTRSIKTKTVGTYTSKIYDSGIPGCRWHRVQMSAEIPANTRIELSYDASDQREQLESGDIEMMGPLNNPGDVLLTGAAGRYFRFRLQLNSDETGSRCPLIEKLYLHFPRTTYLRYLPEVYREDESKRDFSERFLSLFETFLSDSERRIEEFTRYLDPSASPDAFIPWLSSLLAIAYDENWPVDKKRLLIRRAPMLYKKRGTRRVLMEIIGLYYGKKPIVLESFQFDCIEEPEILELIEKLYGTSPYRFAVLLEPRWQDETGLQKEAVEVTAAERRTLRRIIDTEKPAHTVGALHILEPWFHLDMHTYLGINTVLTKPEFRIGKSSVLGRDTVLEDREQAGQIERNSRIGIGFKLT